MNPKYIPEKRKWEQKSWLYEKYWGEELLSVEKMAELVDVEKKAVRESMIEHGIPTRIQGFRRDNSVSPFRGFYNDGARTDEQSRTVYDPDVESEPVGWTAEFNGKTY